MPNLLKFFIVTQKSMLRDFFSSDFNFDVDKYV